MLIPANYVLIFNHVSVAFLLFRKLPVVKKQKSFWKAKPNYFLILHHIPSHLHALVFLPQGTIRQQVREALIKTPTGNGE